MSWRREFTCVLLYEILTVARKKNIYIYMNVIYACYDLLDIWNVFRAYKRIQNFFKTPHEFESMHTQFLV